MNKQTAVDAYCPECETYICDERVTFEECCDTCGTHIEYHTKHTEVTNENNNKQINHAKSTQFIWGCSCKQKSLFI